MRILVVDDDPGVRRYIQRVLERNDMESVAVAGADEARNRLDAERGEIDLMLLDITMPRESGWDFLIQQREAGNEKPTIFLTAHHSIEDRVRGLRMGADDYIIKPFAGEELVARIEAVMRRRESLPTFSVGDLRVDLASRIVERGEERIELSPREFDVLGALVQARGRTVSRRELLRRVWDIEFDPGTKIVEVQIARLRRKLDENRHGSLIETVVGEGYRIPVHGSSA